MLDNKIRYLQIAFNHDLYEVIRVLPKIPYNNRILIEAGTPLIKREGMEAIRMMSRFWKGHIVADLKVSDGAVAEVDMARQAGATAATVLGSAPEETLNLFLSRCAELNMISMIDLLGHVEPLEILRKCRVAPDVVILHKGRDEEHTAGKEIKYKQINKIHSKYESLISAAGGVDLREARSAIFNGSNIVVANLVSSKDLWTGISSESNVAQIATEFLETIN